MPFVRSSALKDKCGKSPNIRFFNTKRTKNPCNFIFYIRVANSK